MGEFDELEALSQPSRFSGFLQGKTAKLPFTTPGEFNEDPYVADSLTGTGVKDAARGLYNLLFGGTTQEQLEQGLMGLGNPLNVLVPKNPRAAQILKSKLPDVFEIFPKLTLHRYQREGPQEIETLRRGGQYFLTSPSNLYYGGLREGGPVKRVAHALVENPLITLSPEDDYSIISKFEGRKQTRDMMDLNTEELARRATKAGAPIKEVALALSAELKRDAVKDVYKKALLLRHGFDSVIRSRWNSPAEAFLAAPRKQIFKNEWPPD